MEREASVTDIRETYTSSRTAKAILDHLANGKTDTAVSRPEQLAYDLQVTRNRVIEVMRALEAAGVGRFVVGRKGHPSRFEWSNSPISVGRVASGASDSFEPLRREQPMKWPSRGEEREAHPLTHRFRLRKDLEVSIELPEDLTASEATRLADFIRTLPFSE